MELLRNRRVVALTGAGMSTDSGIPDYRGESGRRRVRAPVQHRDFIRDPAVRRRYWARSFIGFPTIDCARPNPAHFAVAELEARGVVSDVITQNVDELHQRAGSSSVLELHGALSRVICLACGARASRRDLQARLDAANPGFAASATWAPDGDADIPDDVIGGFTVVGCETCGGALKPDVVFFGDNVDRSIVDDAFRRVERADVLLVLGTSLAVFSGFRFVRRAAERHIPIAIVNAGETRGDALAHLRVDRRLAEILPHLARNLGTAGSP